MIDLYCFPYAGGTSSIYHKWQGKTRGNINVIPVDMPGRGRKSHQKGVKDALQVAKIFADEIMSSGRQDYVLFGHSMGALVAYEVANELRRRNFNAPVAIIVSGRRAPSNYVPSRGVHKMNDLDLIDQLKCFGGTPSVVLTDSEMFDFFGAIIRSDFELLETYQPSKNEPLETPFYVARGLDDREVSTSEMKEWQCVAAQSIVFKEFPGGHFYINDLGDQIVSWIESCIHDAVVLDNL